jgi:hypothetical protein
MQLTLRPISRRSGVDCDAPDPRLAVADGERAGFFLGHPEKSSQVADELLVLARFLRFAHGAFLVLNARVRRRHHLEMLQNLQVRCHRLASPFAARTAPSLTHPAALATSG